MKKQVLCGALAVAAASFVAISAQGTEASAEMNANGISVDCEAQTMTLKAGAGDGSQFFVGTGKFTAATARKPAALKVASWEVYDKLDDITIDLSKLNKQAENYLVIKDAPTGEPVIIKVAAAKKTIAAAYDKATGAIMVKDSGKPYETIGEYRSATSSTWKTVTSDEAGVAKIADINMYQRLGATLYYREKAVNAVCELKNLTPAKESFAYDVETEAKEREVYNVTAFAGVEKKVTVAALAKGPKITVDYAKRTVTFAKDTEYRFVPAGTSANALGKVSYTGVTLDEKKKVVPVTVPVDVLAKGGLVESRTAATATKLASKVAQTYFNAKNTTVVADKKDITVSQSVTIDTDLTLKAEDTYIAKGKTAGYLKVTFNNVSANKYEYITVAPTADGEAVAPAADAKISGSIAAMGRKAGTKALTLAPGTKIYVRQASVNPSKTVAIGVWSTDWAEVATIAAKPADPTPEPTESPDVPPVEE